MAGDVSEVHLQLGGCSVSRAGASGARAAAHAGGRCAGLAGASSLSRTHGLILATQPTLLMHPLVICWPANATRGVNAALQTHTVFYIMSVLSETAWHPEMSGVDKNLKCVCAVLQVKLPPEGVPAPLARSSAAVAGGTPVVETLASSSLWAVSVLKALSQVLSCRGCQARWCSFALALAAKLPYGLCVFTLNTEAAGRQVAWAPAAP